MPEAMRWAVAVTLLAVALPGCECGPDYGDLYWEDPGLYALLDRTTPPTATWDPGAGALPWNGTGPWAGMRLSMVGMGFPPPPGEQRGMFVDVQPPHVEAIRVERDGFLVATVAGDAPEAGLRQAFDRLVANATTGLDAEATWLGFLGSRRDSGMAYGIPLDDSGTRFEERTVWAYSADVRGHLRFDALAARIGLPPPTSGPGELGGASSSAGDWTFSFTLPTWRVQGEHDALDVDSAGHARLEGHHGSEKGIRDAALELARSVGHEPDLSAAQASASIC
jgi:hypothetical protein